ncbi:lytic transglycosylase domain-containing protein [Jhaorihella thermophila]|nr:lytic transglycosylase domain-containing protein [Jhaorihella thermophila]
MRRILFGVIGLVLLCATLTGPALASDSDALKRALAAMRDGKWTVALNVAGRRGSIARDIIVWHWLHAGEGSDGDVLVFLNRRPDWPGLTRLRRKSEPSFTNAAPERVLKFHAGHRPQTAEGALNYAVALATQGREGDAQAEIVLAWRTMPMGEGLQRTYLENYGTLLKPHHWARLDRMLWDGHYISAKRILPLVDEGHRRLAEARIALAERKPGVDALIARVPKALKDDPGLVYARFVWRDRKDLDDSAITLLLARSTSAESLGEPAKWAPRRRKLARQEMRDGDPARAYRIAATHQLTPEDGYSYADLEWLAGYIALRKLNDPARAVEHFKRFGAAVASPISKSRAGYWLGRAYAALGNADKAHDAYAMAADFQTAFYGLLAAERIGRPFDPALANPETPPDWRKAAFLKSSVAQAALLLIKADEPGLARVFLTHLADSLDPQEVAQLGQMAVDLGQPYLAVMIAKQAARRGIILPGAYYPLHPVAKEKLPMAPEMVLAIARRESEFNPLVISGAGARGLMQVMPATAKKVARDLGILAAHATSRLTREWDYNAKLGANYLSGLAGRFDGNVVLMAAGYNAGPGRPAEWIERYGDPRAPAVDVVDWIEHIPFSETRNYVMRVTESLPVYRARLGKPALPIPFSRELKGSTLAAFAPQGE